MKGLFRLSAGMLYILLNGLSPVMAQVVVLNETYTSDSGWHSVPFANPELTIGGGTCNFVNSACNKWSRLYRELPVYLRNTGWTAEADFRYTSTNSAGSGHSVFSLTRDTIPVDYLDANYTPSTNDGIHVTLTSDAPGDTNIYVIAHCRKGSANGPFTAKIPVQRFKQYHVKVEKLSPTQGRCSVLDQNNNHVSQSPQLFATDSLVDSLHVLQHWAGYGFSYQRYLTGTVDNMVITDNDSVALGIRESNRQTVICLFPNPARENIHVKSPVNGQQVCILDVMGRLVWEGQLDKSYISVSELPAGIYYLKIAGTGAARFVKE